MPTAFHYTKTGMAVCGRLGILRQCLGCNRVGTVTAGYASRHAATFTPGHAWSIRRNTTIRSITITSLAREEHKGSGGGSNSGNSNNGNNASNTNSNTSNATSSKTKADANTQNQNDAKTQRDCRKRQSKKKKSLQKVAKVAVKGQNAENADAATAAELQAAETMPDMFTRHHFTTARPTMRLFLRQ